MSHDHTTAPIAAYVIIMGNPIDGLTHLGPFPTHDAASTYAYDCVADEWWIAPIFVAEGPEQIEADPSIEIQHEH